MEFDNFNTCNLRCVVRNGEFSSSTRTKREGHGPLPKVYSDPFLVDLRDFRSHLEIVKCVGVSRFSPMRCFASGR